MSTEMTAVEWDDFLAELEKPLPPLTIPLAIRICTGNVDSLCLDRWAAAWQLLINTGIVWQLPSSLVEIANDYIADGTCSAAAP